MTTMSATPNRPSPDPLIDEVRAIRRKISDRFGNDVTRLIDHLRCIEKQHPGRVVKPRTGRPLQGHEQSDNPNP